MIICSLGTGLIDILGSDDHIFARRLHGWKGFHAMRYLHLPSSLICLAEFSLFVILTVFSTQQYSSLSIITQLSDMRFDKPYFEDDLRHRTKLEGRNILR